MADFIRSCIISGSKVLFGIFFVLFIIGIVARISEDPNEEKNSTVQNYAVGYLNEGAKFAVDNSIQENSEKAKVKIWNNKFTADDGSIIVQIYFLEGRYTGNFALARESDITTDTP